MRGLSGPTTRQIARLARSRIAAVSRCAPRPGYRFAGRSLALPLSSGPAFADGRLSALARDHAAPRKNVPRLSSRVIVGAIASQKANANPVFMLTLVTLMSFGRQRVRPYAPVLG